MTLNFCYSIHLLNFLNVCCDLYTAVENEINQLAETVNSLAINQTGNTAGSAAGIKYPKFWGVAKSVDGNEDYVSFQESPLLMLPETTSNNETLAQFFGITNIYVGGQRLINKKQSELLPDSVAAIDCPVCPTVSAVECPTLPEHIILTVTGYFIKKFIKSNSFFFLPK